MSSALIRRPRCPVCGQDLGPDPWRCTRCDTPHHADCAEYFGGCAIFGCRDGQAPARLEVATWPQVLSTVRWFVRARRLQTWNLLGFCAGVAGLLLLAAVHAPVPLIGVCVAIIFAGGGMLLPTYIAGALLHQRLADQLGPTGAVVESLSERQLRRGVPRLHSPVLRALIRTSLAVSLAGLLAGMLFSTQLACLSVLVLMMAGAIQVVVGTTDHALTVFQNRLQATSERDAKKPALPDRS